VHPLYQTAFDLTMGTKCQIHQWEETEEADLAEEVEAAVISNHLQDVNYISAISITMCVNMIYELYLNHTGT